MEGGGGRKDVALTHGRDNLTLEAKLVLETSSKVGNLALAITANIWRRPDMVKHVTARKQQNSDDRQRSPQVAVLHDGHDVWPGYKSTCNTAENNGSNSDKADVVKRAVDARFGYSIGELAAKPALYGLGARASTRENQQLRTATKPL